jgi:hypothetical protein
MSINIAGVMPANMSFQSKHPPFALSLYSAAHIATNVAIVATKPHCSGIGLYGVQMTTDAIINV